MRTYAGSDAFVRAQKHAHSSASGTGDVFDMLFLPHIYNCILPFQLIFIHRFATD